MEVGGLRNAERWEGIIIETKDERFFSRFFFVLGAGEGHDSAYHSRHTRTQLYTHAHSCVYTHSCIYTHGCIHTHTAVHAAVNATVPTSSPPLPPLTTQLYVHTGLSSELHRCVSIFISRRRAACTSVLPCLEETASCVVADDVAHLPQLTVVAGRKNKNKRNVAGGVDDLIASLERAGLR